MSAQQMSSSNSGLFGVFSRLQVRSVTAFSVIIIGALIAFEMFNYSTTDFALRDLLGNLSFWGISWSTILSIAFCGIDFAGIARLFTPEDEPDEPKEVWYLFGAWILAATMNAILTWWGVSMAIVNHKVTSAAVIDQATITKIVPIFVATMVWVIRILVIGSLARAGNRIFARQEQRYSPAISRSRPAPAPTVSLNSSANYASSNRASSGYSAAQAAPRPSMPTRQASPAQARNYNNIDGGTSVPEPTYHSLSSSARSNAGGGRSQPMG